MRKTGFTVICLFTAILFSSCNSKKNISRPDHIVIVVEENHGFDQIIHSENAPYINQLAKEGTLFINSQGVTHPSQPNYLALFSGSLQGVDGDKCLDKETPYNTPNLGAALLQAGFTFTGYAESLPKAGSLVCRYEEVKRYDYARKHAPWVNWQGDDLQKNQLPDSTNQPLTSFPSDFSKLPTLSFVIPNEGNDMHNLDIDGDTAAIKRGDQWLKEHLSAYVEWARKNNSMLIITFDEDEGESMTHNPIATIFVGEKIKQGQDSTAINHYSVLGTVESMYNLPLSGKAKDAKLIQGIWK
jgi:acid phosphatase